MMYVCHTWMILDISEDMYKGSFSIIAMAGYGANRLSVI